MEAFPLYSHPSSPKVFTQPQLFACLLLKVFYKTDYRGIEAQLREIPALHQWIGLCDRVPDHSTLHRAAGRLLRAAHCDKLLAAIVKLMMPRRKRVRLAAMDASGFESHHVSRYFVERRARGLKGLKNQHYQTTTYQRFPKLAVLADCSNHLVLAMRMSRGPSPDHAYLPSVPVTFHLLLRNATKHALDGPLQSFRRKVDVYCYDTSEAFKDVRVRLGSHISMATMDRIFLPSLLSDVSRVIYLDVDVSLRGDLSALAGADVGPRGICARLSPHRLFSNISTSMRSWGHKSCEDAVAEAGGDWLSFNAGVMVLDLELLRTLDFVDSCCDWVERFGVNDQIACTMFARGDFARLAPAWNTFAVHEWNQFAFAKIVHWAGPRKPWSHNVPLGVCWWDDHARTRNFLSDSDVDENPRRRITRRIRQR